MPPKKRTKHDVVKGRKKPSDTKKEIEIQEPGLLVNNN